jgi:hypothetical protein
MAPTQKVSREQKAEITTRQARAAVDKDNAALRSKTSRLKALRLAKEESEREIPEGSDVRERG